MIWILGALQVFFALRLAATFCKTASGQKVETFNGPALDRVTVVLPVLNERLRIKACLASLIAQPAEVSEILVVDGGSSDGTREIIQEYQSRDRRVRLVDAAPMDPNWTGKAWGLYCGVRAADGADWVLCVDADASFAPELARSLLNHAHRIGVSHFSIATAQRVDGTFLGMLHPALLTTLVYRFGIPGKSTTDLHSVQANGQCFFSRRQTLLKTAAIEAAQHSLCEDITIVRRLAECGEAVGFYEAPRLAQVKMYETWREAWKNWPRSLPMRDRYFGWCEAIGLLEVLLIQALPLWILAVGAVLSLPQPILTLNGILLLTRAGVLLGTARAYRGRPWSYWLSPLLDMPAVLRIITSALKHRQVWRDRVYVRRRSGDYDLEGKRTASG